MKKYFLVLTLMLSMVVSYNSYANNKNMNVNSQKEMQDCKKVKNVNVSVRHSTGGGVNVHASNNNSYKVSISYKLKATNGDRTFVVDSGIFNLKGGESSSGPTLIKTEGYSYYVEVEAVEICE